MGLGSEAATDIFHLIRRLRHDLLNDLQILGGHLQMNKSREILAEDIHAMTWRIQQISRLFACGDDQLALTLWALQDIAADHEIELSIEISSVQRPATPEWRQVLLQVGSMLIAYATDLGVDQQDLTIRLSLPQSATFEVQLANAPPVIDSPDFAVQTETRESLLLITVTPAAGEE